MDGEGKINNVIDFKLKTTFAVFVVFVLMATVAVVFLGIEIPQQQKQPLQEKQQGSDIESSSSSLPASKLTELAEELENQGSSFLEKSTTTTNESQEEQELEFNYLSGLNCNELSGIASSFEDGWGKALAEYNVRCEMDNVNDFFKIILILLQKINHDEQSSMV